MIRANRLARIALRSAGATKEGGDGYPRRRTEGRTAAGRISAGREGFQSRFISVGCTRRGSYSAKGRVSAF